MLEQSCQTVKKIDKREHSKCVNHNDLQKPISENFVFNKANTP